MRTCNVCETGKPDAAFRKAGRGLKKTCMACETGPADESAPAPIVIEASLEVAAGLGFRASLEDGLLCLEQDRPGDDGELYTWTLNLAPHEARQLVDWVAAQVTAA